jgi:hypothetical protein
MAGMLRAIARRWQIPADVLGLTRDTCPYCLRPYP